MKKVIYTNSNGDVRMVIPAPKEIVEKTKGPLTDTEYQDFVLERSIKVDAINVRSINDSDIPESREFRSAWEDTQEGTQIDINCEKARNIKLESLREERKPLLAEQDQLSIMALENGSDLTAIKEEKQRLRDLTNPLKDLNVTGKYNDNVLLREISDLSSFDISKKFNSILNP